jgi:hypothetical protein
MRFRLLSSLALVFAAMASLHPAAADGLADAKVLDERTARYVARLHSVEDQHKECRWLVIRPGPQPEYIGCDKLVDTSWQARTWTWFSIQWRGLNGTEYLPIAVPR